MDRIRGELQNPREFLPKEKFLSRDKFAIIVCNQYYSKEHTTMDDLNRVKDDYKNIMQLVHMMGILPENIHVLRDATHDQLTRLYTELTNKIYA